MTWSEMEQFQGRIFLKMRLPSFTEKLYVLQKPAKTVVTLDEKVVKTLEEQK